MVRFVSLFMVLLFAFVHAFYLLTLADTTHLLANGLPLPEGEDSSALMVLKGKVLAMFYVGFIGEPSDEDTVGVEDQFIHTIISLLFIVLVPVLLLNLLVAMLADTYTRVYEQVRHLLLCMVDLRTQCRCSLVRAACVCAMIRLVGRRRRHRLAASFLPCFLASLLAWWIHEWLHGWRAVGLRPVRT